MKDINRISNKVRDFIFTMKKIVLFIIASISIIFTNTNTNSFQGLGENRTMQDPSTLGLGDSWYFSGQTNGVSIRSSATFWRTRFFRTIRSNI